MDKQISVAAAIIIEDGKVLAAQRGSGELAGGWEFPGGKLEPGETAADACQREIREELGVVVDELAPFASLDYRYPGFYMHLEAFTCRIVQGIISDVEHAAIRWLAPEDLLSVDWLPADVQIVNALHASFLGGAL